MSGLRSAIYEGTVRHRRFSPRRHDFDMPLCMLYADLAELPEIFCGSRLWRYDRPGLASWRRRDYHGDPSLPLDEAVRATVESRLGRRPAGPIRMLTHPRYFGYCFNPVTFYYCFSEDGDRVEAVLAEITNTPWGERHTYAMRVPEDADPDAAARFRFDKAFHVSPFMEMDLEYDWSFTRPEEELLVQMNLRREPEDGPRVFDATLRLRRREISPAALRHTLIRFPFMTLRVILAIHWHALRLWLKKVPVVPHPRHTQTETSG